MENDSRTEPTHTNEIGTKLQAPVQQPSIPTLEPDKKTAPSAIIAIVAIVILVIGVICCLVFLRPKQATTESATTDDSNESEVIRPKQATTESATTDDSNESEVIEQQSHDIAADDEKRIFTAHFIDNDTNSDETMVFNYPTEVKSIETTINKQIYPYYGYEIIKITTDVAEYSKQTICNGETPIRFGGIYRIPSEKRNEYITADSKKKFILDDGSFVYYTDSEPSSLGDISSCDTSKLNEATDLIIKLWQNANFK